MQTFLIILAVLAVFLVLKAILLGGPKVAPTAGFEAVKNGTAVIVDVREPAEWRGGVAEPAALLPLSDLTGPRTGWRSFLEKNKDKQILVYCLSGGRSGHAARLLRREGFNVANMGTFFSWKRHGLPVRKPRAR